MMNRLFSLFRVKSLKLFVIFSACNLWITSGLAEEACGVVTTACPTLNIPYSPQEGVVGTIGNGFDSDRDRYKPMRCLNGTETAIGGGVSTLAATKISSFEQLLERLEVTTKARVRYGVFSAKASAKFVSLSIEKAFSQSFTFAYDIKLNNASFNIDPSNPLNDTGKAAAANSCRFQEICGDQFVYQIERGASLYVNMQFEFSSQYHKQEFDLKAKAKIDTVVGNCCTPLSASISASISSLSEYTRQDGVMRLTAMQVGGNVEQLARVLGTKGDIPSISCSLNNLTACSNALDEIVKYAASTSFSDGVRQYPTNLKYHYGGYWEISPLAPRANIEVTPEIEQARVDLATEYAKRLTDSDRITALLNTALSANHRQQLVTLQTALNRDVQNLQDAANTCFGDLGSCLTKKCQVFNSLTAYSEQALKPTIDDGMVAYYPFSGNTLDKSGNGNDGISYNATLTQDRFGNPNSAYNFNGSGSQIRVIHSPQLDISKSSGFSVVTWFNPAAAQLPIHALIDSSHNLSGSDNTGWVIQCMNDGYYGTKRLYFGFGNGYTMWNGTQGVCSFDNKWHLFVATFDGLKINVYTDGILVGNFLFDPNTSPVASPASLPIFIGTTYGGAYFKGDIDDVRIYKRALSAEEVQTLYQLPNPSEPTKLTVTKQGEGTISAQGIDCGADCTEDYPLNQIVSLTATPATDYTFTNWQGCAIVTSNVCQVTVDAAKTVTATFTQKPVAPPPIVNHTLTVSKQGEGSITGTGINCGTDCTESLAANTQITLTATPAANFTFTSWEGCTSGNNVCQITLDAAKTVTAKFTATITPPVNPPPIGDLRPECVPLHAIYTDADKTLTVPLFEIPMIALVGGVATNKVESYSVTFKSLYDTQHFLIKNVAAPTVEKVAGCAVATYNPETGILSLPYVDVPIIAKLGNTKIETQRLIFQASLHWMPMLGNNIFVVENVTQLQ